MAKRTSVSHIIREALKEYFARRGVELPDLSSRREVIIIEPEEEEEALEELLEEELLEEEEL
jgi:hypothetical protein